MKRSTKLILLAGVGLFVIYTLFKIIQFVNTYQGNQKSTIPEYDALFKTEYRNKIISYGTIFNKGSYPVSMYVYDGKYMIHVFKFNFKSISNSNDFVKLGNKSSNDFMVSSPLPADGFELKSNFTNTDTVANFTLRYDKKLINNVSNNLQKAYYIEFNSFSISLNGSNDFMLWGETDFKPASATCISFLKTGNFVYLILLSKYKAVGKLQPNTLMELLK